MWRYTYADGKVTTTTIRTTTTSTNHSGKLKPDTEETTSITRDNSSGNEISKINYTDTYTYRDGYLTGVSGNGTYEDYDYDENGNLSQSSSGTITRNFVGDSLTIEVTSGTIKDRDGAELGTFRNTTDNDVYDYLERSRKWVLMKKVSKSEYEMTSGSKKGDKEEVTRTTIYSRNEYGTLSGISQTAEGTKVVRRDAKYELKKYEAIFEFNSSVGWHIISEDWDWDLVLVVSPISLSFGEIVKGQSKTMSFTVTNNGGGTLTGNLTANQPWISVNPASFSLSTGTSQNISVTVSPTRELSDNVTSGTVNITSNGGNATVSISVIPTCAIAYPEPISLSSGKMLTFWGTGVAYGTIRIYTLTGELVKELRETNGNDKITWDLTNEQGEKIVRGIYLYTASNPKEPKGNRGKVTVTK